jgi:hypothetical protein
MAIAAVAAPGATVWVHDYQLQLVPAMVRAIRPDVRIGWFNHIPFPPVELSQLPRRPAPVEGLLGADLLGFQRRPHVGLRGHPVAVSPNCLGLSGGDRPPRDTTGWMNDVEGGDRSDRRLYDPGATL